MDNTMDEIDVCEQVILNIQERVMEAQVFSYVDEDSGQLDYYSRNMPVKWPVCLIDITGVNFSSIGMDKRASPQERQQGTGSVTITIANVKLTNTSGNAPLSQKKKAWSIWRLIKVAHVQLQGFSPESSCGKLVRSSLKRVMRDDGVQEYKIIYSVALNNV